MITVERIRVAAVVLLALFVAAATGAGLLFAISSPFWVMLAALAGSSLVASYVLGSD